MNEDKCPFCGTLMDGSSHNGSLKHYCCGSWLPGKLEDRTRECLSRQIAQLQEQLDKTEQLWQYWQKRALRAEGNREEA